jgi:hypothetical protein
MKPQPVEETLRKINAALETGREYARLAHEAFVDGDAIGWTAYAEAWQMEIQLAHDILKTQAAAIAASGPLPKAAA